MNLVSNNLRKLSLLAITFALSMLLIPSAFAQGKKATASDIRSIDFLNYVYQSSVCSEDLGIPKMVKVSKGNFKDRNGNFFYVAKNEIVYGDVNGDGSKDAVVLIRCNGVGTYRAFEVHAYSFQSGQAKLLARLDSTTVGSDYQKSYPDGIVFYAGENGPKIVNGHVIVEALTDGSFAGPENVATFDYEWSDGKFALSGKPQRKRIPSKGSAHSSDQATAQEKKELLELILKDKDVQQNVTDGVSAAAVAQGMTVKKIDLNKDGQPEFIVSLHEALPLGSLCGAHANCPNWVYRKTGSEYQLLLSDRGSLLSLQKTSTNKFRDLRSEGGNTAFEGSFVNYRFDGNEYQAKGCYTRTYATKGKKEKITPFNCKERQ